LGEKVENGESRRRWGVDQRLEFIEFRLFWEGALNRSDLCERFGISVPQASADLTLYQSLVPNGVRYDKTRKTYVPTENFEPRLMRPNPGRYLAQIKAIADDVISVDETWMSRPPSADAMPVPSRSINPESLRKLLEIIRTRQSIEVHYASMNLKRPGFMWRRITPHAFGFDGLRWHVRAYCHIDNFFKDFLLSRMKDLRKPDAAGADAKDDDKWQSFFDIVLEPNPKLTPEQRKTVELDYNMRRGTTTIKVRCALLYHFEKRLRLDTSEEFDSPDEAPVVVQNRVEFKAALLEAKRP
jgi:hypothetical protein